MRTRLFTFSGAYAPVTLGQTLLIFSLALLVLPSLALAATQLSEPDLFFEENRGQFPGDVKFVARAAGYRVVIDESGASYDLVSPSDRQRIRLVLRKGRQPDAVVAADPLPGRIHYFLHADPSDWVSNVPTWSRVILRGVYDGIDMVYRGSGPRPEFDFVVSPGADPGQIECVVEGADAVRVDSGRRLVLRVGDDEMILAPPVAYQMQAGERTPVSAEYAMTSRAGVRFRLGHYDSTRELVIDPVILGYSTRLGGSADEDPTGLKVGADGTLFISGRTTSADFLGGPGSLAGLEDVFVSRLSADGSQLLYTTFIGGSMGEFPLDLAVNTAGEAFVVTQTFSSDFPMERAADPLLDGMSDYAVLQLNAAGVLAYSSYYGGADEEGAGDDGGIALAPNGNVFITGRTLSLPPNGIRLENPYETTCAAQCALVAGFDTSLTGASSLVYGSYVGGDGDDGGQDIGIDAAGDLYVFGFTASDADLIDAGQAFQPVTNDAVGSDNFLMKLDIGESGSAQRVYSTYIGSPQMEAEPRGSLFVESPSSVLVTGATAGVADTVPPYAAGYPIKNAVQPMSGGGEDAFLTKIDTTTTGEASLVFSTFLGGAGSDSGNDVVTDSTGRISVASGAAEAVAPLEEFAAFSAVRLVQLDATGQAIQSALPLPGAFRLAVDADDRVLVTGRTTNNFPELAPLPPSPAGGSEIFLARLGSLPLTGGTLAVDSSAAMPGVNEDYAYALTLTNNGADPLTSFQIVGDFPAGLATLFSALCSSGPGTISCAPADPADFSGPDAILPNERLTLFARARAGAPGSFDIASLTATTVPADPDASDNQDGVNVTVVASPPVSSALAIGDFDAAGLSANTGGFAVDTPVGVLATANGVLDEAMNLMIFDSNMPVFVGDLYSRGRVALGFVERTTWTPADGDGMSLLDLDGGVGTVDRVYAQLELVGRGPLVDVQLRSGETSSASVMLPGARTQVGLDPGKAFSLQVDTGAETAELSYDGQIILTGNPFSSVLAGGADAGDVGDDMVISIGGGRLDLGGARINNVPEPGGGMLLLFGTAGVVGAGRLRSRSRDPRGPLGRGGRSRLL